MSLQSQRMIGSVVALVALASLVIAALVQPIGEWGAWGYVLGAITLMMLFIGLLAMVSKNPSLLMGSKNDARAAKWNRIAAVILAIALVLLVVAGFISGWTATEVMQVGIFASLECMMVGSWVSKRNQDEAGSPT